MIEISNIICSPPHQLYQLLRTSEKGLSTSEANRRMLENGPNIIHEEKQESFYRKFGRNLVDALSILLFFASFLAYYSGSPELAIAILIVIFVNATFTYYQEWAAQQQLQSLKNWIPQYAKVIREDIVKRILVKDLVIGDIIVLEEGDRVPADARIIESYDLYLTEIPLTGEFEPQLKKCMLNETEMNLTKEEPTKLNNLIYENIVYMSTSIIKGNGKAVVFATGMNTKFGHIANLTQTIKVPLSPLQKEIKYFSMYSFILSFLVGGIFFAIGYWVLDLDIYTTTIFVMGVMIACVPEGLQATISSSLAINVSQMAKLHVLIKKLSIVQSLGSVTLICTDKTGTLTKGEMTVNRIWVMNRNIEVSGVGYIPHGEFTMGGNPLQYIETNNLWDLLKIGALCNTANLVSPNDESQKTWGIIGDTTDGALLVAALKAGINFKDQLRKEAMVHLFPFDANRKTITTIHSVNGTYCAYIKGAPGNILKLANSIQFNRKVIRLTPSIRRIISEKYEEFGRCGLRVIAIARKDNIPFIKSSNSDWNYDRDSIERDCTVVGLVGMKDPPRSDVKAAIKTAHYAGIKVIMITGDYGLTAKNIAEEVGIITKDEPIEVIRGEDLGRLPDNTLGKFIREKKVIFCRVSPEDKLRIVSVANQIGEIVAVTGDGANDAPALKRADIGIAMGVTGTDVAKEASDMILTDDSFASIVKGIEGGRNIWLNLRKFVYFVYTHNWAELIPYIFFILLQTPLPILAVHILMIDLCIDIIPSLALSRIAPEPTIMEGPPRDLREHLFNGPVFARSFFIGAIIGTFAFVGCFFVWQSEGWILGQLLVANSPIYLKGITFTYVAIVVGQMANLFSCQSFNSTIFHKKMPLGMLFFYSIMWQLAILLATIYIPSAQPIFGTYPISLALWGWILGIIPIVIFASEGWKLLAKYYPVLKT